MFGFIGELPTKGIMAQDEFFKVMGRRAETNALAYRATRNEYGSLREIDGKTFDQKLKELKDNPKLMGRDIQEQIDNFAREIVWPEQDEGIQPTGRIRLQHLR